MYTYKFIFILLYVYIYICINLCIVCLKYIYIYDIRLDTVFSFLLSLSRITPLAASIPRDAAWPVRDGGLGWHLDTGCGGVRQPVFIVCCAGAVLSAFTLSGVTNAWLPGAWATFWLLFFAVLRSGRLFKALSMTQVLALQTSHGTHFHRAMFGKRVRQNLIGVVCLLVLRVGRETAPS